MQKDCEVLALHLLHFYWRLLPRELLVETDAKVLKEAKDDVLKGG